MIAAQADFVPVPKNGCGRSAQVILRRASRHVLVFALTIGFALLVGACASVPSQEMSDARRALNAAEQADARRLLPITMGRASANLDSANSALRAGQYEQARLLARSARDEAIAARVLATRLVQVREAIARARAEDRAWQDAEQLVQRALAMSRAGDTRGALSSVEQAAMLVP